MLETSSQAGARGRVVPGDQRKPSAFYKKVNGAERKKKLKTPFELLD
jgi:hypothetical protein